MFILFFATLYYTLSSFFTVVLFPPYCLITLIITEKPLVSNLWLHPQWGCWKNLEPAFISCSKQYLHLGFMWGQSTVSVYFLLPQQTFWCLILFISSFFIAVTCYSENTNIVHFCSIGRCILMWSSPPPILKLYLIQRHCRSVWLIKYG